MNDTTESQQPAPLTSEGVELLALALANGQDPNLSGLSWDDAAAVLRRCMSIIQQRRRRAEPLPPPPPAHQRMPRQAAPLLMAAAGIRPSRIVWEILSEPLMQAALWALSQGVMRAWMVALEQVHQQGQQEMPPVPGPRGPQ